MSWNFGILDYVVIAITQIVCIMIGWYYAKKGRKTMENYAFGDRSMSVFPAGMSLMATYVNAFAMVSHVSEMFMYGLHYGVWNVSLGCGTIFAAYAVLPIFHRSKYTSIYEVLERKYGSAFRQIYTAIYCLIQLLYCAIALYVPGVVLSTTTGLPYWISTVVFGAICIGYSTLGGFKAVVWTDVFQAFLMLLSMMIITTSAIVEVGGLQNVARTINSTEFLNFSFFSDPHDKYSLSAITLNGLISSIIYSSTNQHILQRTLCVKNLKKATRASWIAFSFLLIFHASLLTSASAIFAYFKHCDSNGNSNMPNFKSNDQVVPVFIIRVLTKYTGLAGLVVSGIFCGSLSTLSSTINSCAVVVTSDFFQRYASKKIYKKYHLIVCKMGTVLFGLSSILFSLLLPLIGGAIHFFMIILGIVVGPFGACFLIVMFRRNVNVKAVLLSIVLSTAFASWVSIGASTQNITYKKTIDDPNICSIRNNSISTEYPSFNSSLNNESLETQNTSKIFWLYNISPAWYLIFGFSICFFGSIIFSLPFKSEADSPLDILSPWVLSKDEKKSLRSAVKTKEETSIDLLQNVAA